MALTRNIIIIWSFSIIFFNNCAFAINAVNEIASEVGNYDPVRNIIPLIRIEAYNGVKYKQAPSKIKGHYCSATMLNDQYLVTARHCLDDLPIVNEFSKHNIRGYDFTVNKIEVYLPKARGSEDDSLYFHRKQVRELNPPIYQDIGEIEAFYLPPREELGEYLDFAIIKLRNPLATAANVEVSVPSPQQINFSDRSGMMVYGWGSGNENYSQLISDWGHLREAPIAGLLVLNDDLRHQLHIQNQSDTGDGGAPLLKKIGWQKYLLLGTLSSETRLPNHKHHKGTALVNLTYYSKWIGQIVDGTVPDGTTTCILKQPCIIPRFHPQSDY